MVRKNSRAAQELPASADAFVWHRLYQQELLRLGVPRGRRQPAWWTLRRAFRPHQRLTPEAEDAREFIRCLDEELACFPELDGRTADDIDRSVIEDSIRSMSRSGQRPGHRPTWFR